MYTGIIKFDGNAALQKWAIYVLKAIPKIPEKNKKILIYGGKVGDNNTGCNPVISRLGNHLSENKIHSQLKNKSANFSSIDDYNIVMIYLHIEDYVKETHKSRLNMVNESERHLIRRLRNVYAEEKYSILNKFTGSSFTNKTLEKYAGHLNIDERNVIDDFTDSTFSIED